MRIGRDLEIEPIIGGLLVKKFGEWLRIAPETSDFQRRFNSA
jgi:hypothetical protein